MNTIYDGSFVLGNTNELTFSAGPGIKIDSPSEGVVRIGNDETVLWEVPTGTYCISGSDTFVLNEPASSFKKLQFTVTDNSYKSYNLTYIDSTITGFDLSTLDTVDANTFAIRKARVSTTDYTNYTIGDFARVNFTNNSTINYAGYYGARITKVIGINRISGSNA